MDIKYPDHTSTSFVFGSYTVFRCNMTLQLGDEPSASDIVINHQIQMPTTRTKEPDFDEKQIELDVLGITKIGYSKRFYQKKLEQAIKLMNGWSGYGWKTETGVYEDREYIDDIQSYFDDALGVNNGQ